MSLQSVQQFFADNAPDIEIIELGVRVPRLLRWLLPLIALSRDKSPRRYR